MTSIETEISSEESTLRLRGTVGIREAGRLCSAAREVAYCPGRVRVDCTELVGLDPAAAQVLCGLMGLRTQVGRSFELIGVSGRVARLLETAGFSSLLLRRDG